MFETNQKKLQSKFAVRCEVFMTTIEHLVPIYLNDIKDYWVVENIYTTIRNPVDQKPQKPKKKYKTVDILANSDHRSDWSVILCIVCVDCVVLCIICV